MATESYAQQQRKIRINQIDQAIRDCARNYQPAKRELLIGHFIGEFGCNYRKVEEYLRDLITMGRIKYMTEKGEILIIPIHNIQILEINNGNISLKEGM